MDLSPPTTTTTTKKRERNIASKRGRNSKLSFQFFTPPKKPLYCVRTFFRRCKKSKKKKKHIRSRPFFFGKVTPIRRIDFFLYFFCMEKSYNYGAGGSREGENSRDTFFCRIIFFCMGKSY